MLSNHSSSNNNDTIVGVSFTLFSGLLATWQMYHGERNLHRALFYLLYDVDCLFCYIVTIPVIIMQKNAAKRSLKCEPLVLGQNSMLQIHACRKSMHAFPQQINSRYICLFVVKACCAAMCAT